MSLFPLFPTLEQGIKISAVKKIHEFKKWSIKYGDANLWTFIKQKK